MLKRRIAAVVSLAALFALLGGCARKDTGRPAAPVDEVVPAAGPAKKERPAAGPEIRHLLRSDAVWGFPEYHRVDPVTGAVAEHGFKPLDPAFRRRNDVYDAETNSVSLVAMKGETVAFQVMIEGDLKDVTLKAEGLPGRTSFIYEGYLHYYDDAAKTVRYAPEVSVPMEWIGGRFDVVDAPEQLPGIEGKRMQAVWVDVRVPRDAKAGLTGGTITVLASGKAVSEIPVGVKVADCAIPEQPTYINAMIQYGQFARKRPQVGRDAYRQVQAHRCAIHDIPYSSQRGWGYEGAVPKTTLSPVFARAGDFRDEGRAAYAKGGYEFLPEIAALKDPKMHTVKREEFERRLKDTMPMHDMILRECRRVYAEKGAGVTDWAEFDKRYGPLFDGSAFDDGVPVATFELPFNYNWPAPLDRFGIMQPSQSEMYEDIWVRVAQDFLRHANAKGWTRTQFFVYNNPKNRWNNLAMWKGDEPCEKHDFLAHKYWHGLFKKAFADPGKVKVDYKLEVGHWECDACVCRKRHYDSKTWDESNAREMLRGVTAWVPNSRHYHGARKMAWRQIDEQGDTFYTYGGLSTFDRTSMAIYAIAFQAFEDRTKGYFYYVPDVGDLSVWRENPGLKIRDTKAARPNNNILHYDASAFGKDDRMLMSLRFKALRGIEGHYAAFKAAEARDPAFAAELKRRMVKYVVQTGGRDEGSRVVVKNNNPADLYTARLKAIGIASGDASIGRGREYEGPIPGVSAKSDAFHYCVNCGEACSPLRCEWCGAVQQKEKPPATGSSKYAPVPSKRTAAGEKRTYGRDRIVIEVRMDKTFPERDLTGGINVGGKGDQKDYLLLEGDGKQEEISRSIVKFSLDELKAAADVHSARLLLCQSSISKNTPFEVLVGAACVDIEKLGAYSWSAASGVGIIPGSESVTTVKEAGEKAKYMALDATQAVRFMIANRHINNGFVIRLRNENRWARIKWYSSSSSGGRFAPKLVITFAR